MSDGRVSETRQQRQPDGGREKRDGEHAGRMRQHVAGAAPGHEAAGAAADAERAAFRALQQHQADHGQHHHQVDHDEDCRHSGLSLARAL